MRFLKEMGSNPFNQLLLKLATERRKQRGERAGIQFWYGCKATTSRRTFTCYVCNCTIATESAKWKGTAQTSNKIEAHGQEHFSGEFPEIYFESTGAADLLMLEQLINQPALRDMPIKDVIESYLSERTQAAP